jgi:hypothetical protein
MKEYWSWKTTGKAPWFLRIYRRARYGTDYREEQEADEEPVVGPVSMLESVGESSSKDDGSHHHGVARPPKAHSSPPIGGREMF